MPIRKSSVSGGSTPSGTTADRPANPSIGDTFFNGTLGVQEIYTSSGWLPATGANDFNVVLDGEDTSVTLDKEYFAGAYTISSALSDTSFDIYLFDTQGNSAGYTKSPSVNATSNFNKIVVLGGQQGDLLSFSYKTTFVTSAETSATGAGPIIKSISVSDLPNIDDTTVITGINFAEDVQVTFTGTNSVSLSAKSVVRSSATSLLVTRPDTLIEDYSPYTVTVTNPGVTAPTGTGGHIATNAITAGGDPVWVTPGSLPSASVGQAYSVSLQANDPDNGPIEYQIISGSLPNGLSLNGTTGEISGTNSVVGTNTFVVAAIDAGGNATNKTFMLADELAYGGVMTTYNGYNVHTFTSNGTFVANVDLLQAEYLVVAGGASGGGNLAGGGGAGGLVSNLNSPTTLLADSYSITVGAGGAGVTGTQTGVAGNNGIDSTLGNLITAIGGGGGGGGAGPISAVSGGSGGGGSGYAATSGATGLQPSSTSGGYGNSGGNGAGSSNQYRAGGGGGAGQAGTNGVAQSAGGFGGNGLQINIDGNNYYWAGGGGGGSYSGTGGGGNGGLGGGGGGGTNSASGGSGGGSALNAGSDGLATQTDGSVGTNGGGAAGQNTGSGGGGTGHQFALSGAGGSGIVIIRYPI